jgi:hypothetical protein
MAKDQLTRESEELKETELVQRGLTGQLLLLASISRSLGWERGAFYTLHHIDRLISTYNSPLLLPNPSPKEVPDYCSP